jgi:hypothetical protein
MNCLRILRIDLTDWRSKMKRMDATMKRQNEAVSNNETSTYQIADAVHFNLVITNELNERLESLAKDGQTTKCNVLRKAIALFDIVAEANANKKRFGILDKDRNLITEIVGL